MCCEVRDAGHILLVLIEEIKMLNEHNKPPQQSLLIHKQQVYVFYLHPLPPSTHEAVSRSVLC